jgi:hypothetical protein
VADALGIRHVVASGDPFKAQRDAVVGLLTSIVLEREWAQRVLEALAAYGHRKAAEQGIESDEEIVRLTRGPHE